MIFACLITSQKGIHMEDNIKLKLVFDKMMFVLDKPVNEKNHRLPFW